MTAPSPAPAPRSPAPWILAGLVVLGLAVTAYYLWPRPEPVPPDEPPPSTPLPPLTTSPFINTRPGVAYVGDESCRTCHPDHVDSYHHHSMGQSLYTTAEAPPLEGFDSSANNPMQAGRFHFQVIRDGKRLIQREWCQDANGKVVASKEAEIDFVVGSGAHARSYVFAEDGFLFQAPLTWYRRTNGWDLSPGYAENPLHFRRPIDSRCLYCHSQDSYPVPHTNNRYRDPVFGQTTIGCERCHGPGYEHVDYRADGLPHEGIDYTIVNPKHLSPALRENICEQCHLQGEAVVIRRGRAQNEFRPGLPLNEYVSVFVRPPDALDITRIVGHAEQMRLSACFNNSNGKFGCTSCHDPHKLPAAEKKLEFYRNRCLHCHDRAEPADDRSEPATACSIPVAERTAKAPGDNCITCHMPRNPSSNVTHFVLTDHRVIRSADKPPPTPANPRTDGIPLLAFHRNLRPDDPERPRDLGMALSFIGMLADGLGDVTRRGQIAEWALPLLDAAVARAPDDVPAREARGFTLFSLGRNDEALAELDAALALAPEREDSLRLAAHVAEEKGDLERAEQYARRLTAAYPYFPPHKSRLATILAKQQKWTEALKVIRDAVKADPFQPDSRALLISALLETGDEPAARVEFDILGAVDPEYRDRLKPWFAERLRRSRKP